MQILLTNEERDLLLTRVSGEGDWQSLMRKLQGQLSGNTLSVDQDDLDRAEQYSAGQRARRDEILPLLPVFRAARNRRRQHAKTDDVIGS